MSPMGVEAQKHCIYIEDIKPTVQYGGGSVMVWLSSGHEAVTLATESLGLTSLHETTMNVFGPY